MIPVVIESPYAASQSGTVEQHVRYLDDCVLWCVRNGYSPYASHALVTRVYSDLVDEEREAGIQAGYAFHDAVGLVMVFTDLGISPGMQRAIDRCRERGTQLVFQQIKP